MRYCEDDEMNKLYQDLLLLDNNDSYVFVYTDANHLNKFNAVLRSIKKKYNIPFQKRPNVQNKEIRIIKTLLI